MASEVADCKNDSALYEEQHVHDVYEQIASHFSSTRYKPWPVVAHFLLSQRPGSVGIDVGAGNGKYLAVNPAIHILASDRSPSLLAHARIHTRQGANDLLVADALALPHPAARFDFALSIAAVHHLSTRARRVEAVRAMLACLRPQGRCLLFVWALEQKSSRRGWDEGMAQDVMVPWVRGDETFERYYHLYRAGELEEDIERAAGEVVEKGYERDNWWAVASPKSRDSAT